MGSTQPGFNEEQYRDLWYASAHKTPDGEHSLKIFRAEKSDGDAYWIKYVDGTSFFIAENASKIWVTWQPESSVEDAATYLLGPVMAVVAQMRNKTCLHASAVVVDGRILAILGASGAGKSTSAAAFARAGYPVVTDDVLIVSERDGCFVADPAYPNLRLWPASVETLFGRPDALPLLTPTWDKRGLSLNQSGYCFQEDPLPIGALYVLGERSCLESAPYITPILGNAALINVVTNSLGLYNKPLMLAQQLQLLGKLSNAVPVRELVAHEDPRRLPELCQLLVDDVRSIRAGKSS